MRETNRKWTVLLGCVLLAAVLFYVLNVLTPLYADDHSYTRNFFTKEPIASLGDIVESMIVHYKTVNGRIPVHFLDQLFLWWGKPWFNLINTAAFLAAILLACRLAGPLSPGLFLAMACGVFLLAPGFGQSYLWVTGSANYLFSVLPALVYLNAFQREAERGGKYPVLKCAGFLLLGVLAGWTQENSAVAFLCAAVGLVAVNRAEGRPFRPWMAAGLLGGIAGFLALLLAPAQRVRLENSGGSGTIFTWINHGKDITYAMVEYFWPLLLIFAGLLVAWFHRPREGRWRRLLPSAVWLAAAMASAYAMVIAPYFPERAWSVPLLFLLISAARLYRQMSEELRLPSWGIALLAACCVLVYGLAIRELTAVRDAVLSREATVRAEKAAGAREVTVPMVSSQSRYSCFEVYGDLGEDPTDWKNVAFARYWDLDIVRGQR